MLEAKIAPTPVSNWRLVRRERGRLTKTNHPYLTRNFSYSKGEQGEGDLKLTNLSELTTWVAPFKASFFASFPLSKSDQLQEKRENRPSHAKPGNISDTQKIQSIQKKSKTFQKFPRSPKKSYNSERNPKEPKNPTTIPKTLKFLTNIQKFQKFLKES